MKELETSYIHSFLHFFQPTLNWPYQPSILINPQFWGTLINPQLTKNLVNHIFEFKYINN